MKTEWTKGLSDPIKRKEFEDYLRNSNILLYKLSEICYNRVKELKKSNLEDYDSPSWSHKEAHKNGMRQAFQYIIDLCEIKDH